MALGTVRWDVVTIYWIQIKTYMLRTELRLVANRDQPMQEDQPQCIARVMIVVFLWYEPQ